MFRSQPKKSDLIDQLDVQIEEHKRISKVLETEFDSSRQDVEKYAKKDLKKAAKLAYDGMKEVKNKLEATEITRIQLRRVRTQLLAQPERLPTKTIQGVDQLLKASQKQLQESKTTMMPLLERAKLYDENILSVSDMGSSDSDDEFEAFLDEIGLGEKEAPASEEMTIEPMPEVPLAIEGEKTAEEKKPIKKELKEDTR